MIKSCIICNREFEVKKGKRSSSAKTCSLECSIKNNHLHKKNYYSKNRKEILIKSKKYYEEQRKRSHDWYYANIKRRRLYMDENKNKINDDQKKRRLKRRVIVLIHYGGNPPKCVCCGETLIEFLTIDHINNNGAKHRDIIGKSGHALYDWLIKNNFPEGYQVMCWNCNWAKSHGGCPHQKWKRLLGPLDTEVLAIKELLQI